MTGSVSATAKQGRLAPGLRLPTDNEVPDGMEKRVTDICNRLSNFVDGAKEIDGDGTALCYKSKSFEVCLTLTLYSAANMTDNE